MEYKSQPAARLYALLSGVNIVERERVSQNLYVFIYVYSVQFCSSDLFWLIKVDWLFPMCLLSNRPNGHV